MTTRIPSDWPEVGRSAWSPVIVAVRTRGVPRHATNDTNRYDRENRDLTYWVPQCPPLQRGYELRHEQTHPVPSLLWISSFFSCLPATCRGEIASLNVSAGACDSSVSVSQTNATRTSHHPREGSCHSHPASERSAIGPERAVRSPWRRRLRLTAALMSSL